MDEQALGANVQTTQKSQEEQEKIVYIHTPINLSYRLLNIFKKGGNLGLNAVERTVNTVERMIDHQHSAREFLASQRHVKVERIEDITPNSEDDTSYAARQARTQQLSCG